jgi:hypothetical protein
LEVFGLQNQESGVSGENPGKCPKNGFRASKMPFSTLASGLAERSKNVDSEGFSEVPRVKKRSKARLLTKVWAKSRKNRKD